jgi:hypothetical protein
MATTILSAHCGIMADRASVRVYVRDDDGTERKVLFFGSSTPGHPGPVYMFFGDSGVGHRVDSPTRFGSTFDLEWVQAFFGEHPTPTADYVTFP